MAFIPLSRAGWTATASSIVNTAWPASNALDGNTGTAWHSAEGYPHYLDVDMGFTPLSRSGWTLTADSIYPGYPTGNAVDDNTSTSWYSAAGYPHYLDVDMGSAQTFSAIRFVPEQNYPDYPANVEVYVSDDGSTWGSAIATATWATDATTKLIQFSAVTRRWFRLRATSGNSTYMACAEIYAGNVSAKTFSAIQFVGRADARMDPGAVEIYVSDDGSTWGAAVATGTFISSAAAQEISFSSVTKRWFRFRATSSAPGSPYPTYLACSEIYAGDITGAPAANIRLTQETLEVAVAAPPAGNVKQTQEALEFVTFSTDSEIWMTQLCLEVAVPAKTPCPDTGVKRNHLYHG